MKKFVRFALVAAVAAGLFLAPNASHASDTHVVEFVGNATLSDGLWSPGLGPSKTVTWSFDSAVACVDDAGTTCTISASGTVTGHCGLSTAPFTGSGTYISSNGQSHAITEVGWIQSAGGTIPVQGKIDGKPFTAVVQAVPTSGSCSNGTANGFTVSGTGALA